MNMKTFSIETPASKTELFNYLSDISALPEWATEFCKELKTVDGHSKVTTPMGEIFFEIHGDTKTGVIDFATSPDGKQFRSMPSRVIGLPNGGSAYIVTFVQEPGMNDDMFSRQCQSLDREMENIRARFS